MTRGLTAHHGLSDLLLRMPRVGKRTLALLVDALLCCGTTALAFYLRLGRWELPHGNQWLFYVSALVIALPLFIQAGLYRAIFRYVGWDALVSVVRACAIYGMISATLFTMIGVHSIPRTVGLIQPILLFLAIGTSRALARYWLGDGYRALLQGHRRRVLIYGAGSAGRQLAAAMAGESDLTVVAFVDDDRTLHWHLLNGRVIHPSDNLHELVEQLKITDVLLAIPSATRRRRGEILEMMRGTSATIRTLPGVADLARGLITINDLRELDIEDLLGRDPVAPDLALLERKITGKSVLVTGAGGSIGSELCRQVLALKPRTLVLLDLSEFALYAIHQELETLKGRVGAAETRVTPLLGSVTDRARLELIMEAWRPQTVYHAAAYKHVPLVEHNPVEGVRNNVFGTLVAARASARHGVEDFVLISTDKAVRPTNVMGATKRLAELILQALAERGGKTRFSMVRFGNVLGSSGSVVPLFRRQISEGGPITITHAEVTRYFMTIPEAAQLVIQAGAMAHGGEVFVLDMGEPVRIIDLARNMIELSGLKTCDENNPDGDIAIEVVGLRPGEKLYEELLIRGDDLATGHPRIRKAREHFVPWPELAEQLSQLEADIADQDPVRLRVHLNQCVREFTPGEELVDFIQLQRDSWSGRDQVATGELLD